LAGVRGRVQRTRPRQRELVAARAGLLAALRRAGPLRSPGQGRAALHALGPVLASLNRYAKQVPAIRGLLPD
ncbi:MAG: hypothetical protein ACR2NH_08135, partial [Solirubrobacteraceae bacterium]